MMWVPGSSHCWMMGWMVTALQSGATCILQSMVHTSRTKLHQSMTVFRDVQVPHHVLHGDPCHPAEQQPHKFPEWKVTLEERVEPNVPFFSAKSTLPSEPIGDISLRDESAVDLATNTLVSVAQQSSASQPLNLKLDVALEHQAELERTQLLH